MHMYDLRLLARGPKHWHAIVITFSNDLSFLRNMDDSEIQSTVESILGPGVKVIDCEKKNCIREEEVLLINGVPIALEGPDGVAIREAMITGQIPPCDLLNQILVRAGILR